MKQFLYIVIGAALMVLLLLVLRGRGEESAQDTRSDASAPARAHAPHPQSVPARAEDHAPPAAAALPPGLQDRKKVTFDRGPKGSDEHPSRYRDRKYFVERFDEFVKQARPTEEQVQKVLLALYDYQTQYLALDEDWDEATSNAMFTDKERFNELLDDDSTLDVKGELWDIMQIRISRALDWRQEDAWSRTCIRCEGRLTMPHGHGQPILRLEE